MKIAVFFGCLIVAFLLGIITKQGDYLAERERRISAEMKNAALIGGFQVIASEFEKITAITNEEMVEQSVHHMGNIKAIYNSVLDFNK